MAQELLRLNKAKVRRDGRYILDVDSFVVEEGETVVILGPNGSGKSTLIKLLTREMMPLWHEDVPVRFMGDDHASLEDINKTVGIVSMSKQEFMMTHRKVLDIVLGGFFGSVGVPYHFAASDEQIRAAYSAIRELGITGLAERDMLTLSTGQVRRVMIARALINGPKVLVFDEPCTGLDVEAKWHLRQSLSALAKSGRTILLVTHDVEDIVPEFKRVVMLQDAHIVADGPKEELLTTARLRHLFGVPITLVENDGRYHLQ
ncbi:MAG: ABC transporter ATP-binding protein [Coriobacteriales bacterium]|jgi:iron complex transport system ATP-binding protein